MPDNCMPPVNVRSSELHYFERAASSGESWHGTRCRNCPGLRTPSIHANFCLMSSEIVTRRSTTSQEVLAAAGIQTRNRSRDQSSRYFGVRFRPDLSKWVAEIRVAEWKAADKKVWLGTFESEEGAARAVDAARKLLNCRKKRPPNFPCEKLDKYSEKIPSYLHLTDLNNDTMFKHVTQFVKKKSQEYSGTFKIEDIQALLSELPELKIAPQDPLDPTIYSQDSIEDVLADQVGSEQEIKPCAMRSISAASVSDESDYNTIHSHSHSQSHSFSSVPQTWRPEDAGGGNCILGNQDMPIAKRLKLEPMVIDDVKMSHSHESTEFPCNSTFDPLKPAGLHSNFSGFNHQRTDAEVDLELTQECSIVHPCFWSISDEQPLDILNFECNPGVQYCTTWQDQPMAMNVEPFESIFNEAMGAETTWLMPVQPFTSSYIRESFENSLLSRMLDPISPSPEVMINLSPPPPSQTNIHVAGYLNTSHGLQGDGTANYGCSWMEDCMSNLDYEHYPPLS